MRFYSAFLRCGPRSSLPEKTAKTKDNGLLGSPNQLRRSRSSTLLQHIPRHPFNDASYNRRTVCREKSFAIPTRHRHILMWTGSWRDWSGAGWTFSEGERLNSCLALLRGRSAAARCRIGWEECQRNCLPMGFLTWMFSLSRWPSDHDECVPVHPSPCNSVAHTSELGRVGHRMSTAAAWRI